jgi:hypothetical protein
MNSLFPINSEATYGSLIGDMRDIKFKRRKLFDFEEPQGLDAHASVTSTVNEASEQGIVLPPENLAMLELLRAWRENDDPEDEAEQKSTWEYLKKALDED